MGRGRKKTWFTLDETAPALNFSLATHTMIFKARAKYAYAYWKKKFCLNSEGKIDFRQNVHHNLLCCFMAAINQVELSLQPNFPPTFMISS